jgi:hypothetical protein
MLLAAIASPGSRADDDAAQKATNACVDNFGYVACAHGAQSAPPRPTVGYDPCYLAQNAMRPCTPGQQPAARQPGVDGNFVGTWTLALERGPWVLEIFRNGTYKFHSEAGDGATPHQGTFSARDGHWSLQSTAGYTDGGTYVLRSPDTWVATGRLGTGTWRRQPMQAASGRQSK